MVSPTELARSVWEKSRESKLRWEELSENGYIASIGENSVAVDKIQQEYYLRFINEDGKVAATIDSRSAGMVRDRNALTGPERSLVEEIYNIARQQVLRTDETLINIHRNLQKL